MIILTRYRKMDEIKKVPKHQISLRMINLKQMVSCDA